jgi:hypothetical protein
LTFIEKNTGIFAALGHGICDTDTGEMMPIWTEHSPHRHHNGR